MGFSRTEYLSGTILLRLKISSKNQFSGLKQWIGNPFMK